MNDALLALAENEDGLYSDQLLKALLETMKKANWPKSADPSRMLA